MPIAAVFDRADFEAALRASREIGAESELVGLAAPLDGALWGRISAAWDTVEHALRQAFQYGIDYASESVGEAIAAVEKVLQDAGRRARDVHEAFLTRLQQYLTGITDSALASVRTVVSIGSQTFTLGEIELSHKISLTGSLKVNITEIAALTGAGEMTVVAHYSSGQPV
jgi:hypothetical protein